MRIRVEINDTFSYRVFEGKVLNWCSGVEHYCASDNSVSVPLQVPTVVLHTDDQKVLVVTLQKQFKDIKILVLES